MHYLPPLQSAKTKQKAGVILSKRMIVQEIEKGVQIFDPNKNMTWPKVLKKQSI